MSGKRQGVRGLIARMKRRGVLITLVGGRPKVDGWSQLAPEEQEQLRDDRERIVAWLESREFRRQRRAERKRKEQEQQAKVQQQPQSERRVVGQVVNPGGPLRLLYEDECKPIAPSSRARQLPSFAWSKFIGGEE